MTSARIDSSFDKAVLYRHLALALPVPASASNAVREADDPNHRILTERHLHCIWYDDNLRPATLRTMEGTSITVKQPGHWNLEAGPDFLDAVLCVGNGSTILRGDIEIHISPQDWNHHGHATDPAYANVIAHVCYKSGAPPDSLPIGTLHIDIGEAIRNDGSLHLEDIDMAAYPYSLPDSGKRPCAQHFPELSLEQQCHILAAAGQERLRLKAHRMARALEHTTTSQLLYEEIMAAMGYKHNRTPFRLLASAAPVDILLEESAGDALVAYAILLGLSGLIPDSLPNDADNDSKEFIRTLWDQWWKHQSVFGERLLGPLPWNMSSLRPQNNPARRLVAVTSLFCEPDGLHRSLLEMNPFSIDAIRALLTDSCSIPHWTRRLAISGKQQQSPTAILGQGRISSIIINVIIPFLTAAGEDTKELLDNIPTEEANSLTREMLGLLMGSDHNPVHYRQGIIQQGLIQIFNDYCLDKSNTCDTCPFASALCDISSAQM
jgi:hypothetical protein